MSLENEVDTLMHFLYCENELTRDCKYEVRSGIVWFEEAKIARFLARLQFSITCCSGTVTAPDDAQGVFEKVASIAERGVPRNVLRGCVIRLVNKRLARLLEDCSVRAASRSCFFCGFQSQIKQERKLLTVMQQIIYQNQQKQLFILPTLVEQVLQGAEITLEALEKMHPDILSFVKSLLGSEYQWEQLFKKMNLAVATENSRILPRSVAAAIPTPAA